MGLRDATHGKLSHVGHGGQAGPEAKVQDSLGSSLSSVQL